jgi:hypothetical protein
VSKPSLTTVEPPSNLPQPIRIEPGGLPWPHPVAEQKPEQQTLQLDEKCGTIALFHYGLIAPLVLERSLPARELNRRVREIAARVYDVPIPNGHGFRR